MQSQRRNVLSVLVLLLAAANMAFSQESPAKPETPIHLQVEAGTPLRIYVTRRVPYRVGQVVEAKLIEPVWAFDRIVIPAGATLQGQVVRLDPVPKIMRARAILGGDFTPLKRAEVSFTNLTLPDGKAMPLETKESLGLPTIYLPPRPAKKPKKPKAAEANRTGVGAFLRQQAQAQLHSQASARSRGLYDLVRGPNKREWVENYIMSKLPYHPQWYRARTRFDTVLSQPLDFGTVDVASSELTKPGTAVPPNAVGQMRLLTTISSADAQVGDSMQGVLSQPIFSQTHELVLPEGTRFLGKITLTQHARLFHRGGKLRFTIENVDLPQGEVPSETAGTQREEPVQGQLVAVEADPNAIKVDSEGTATSTESKTRLLRPAIATLVAMKSLDNDAGRQTASGTASAPNNFGLALGGFSGFGLLGTVAARGPSPIGEALGFYGLAWSVYSNIVARGSEVTFEKNTAIAIQFGAERKK